MVQYATDNNNNDNNNNDNNNNNNNNTYIAPISKLLFSSAFKNKNILNKNNNKCIKYTCKKCMSQPKRVKQLCQH